MHTKHNYKTIAIFLISIIGLSFASGHAESIQPPPTEGESFTCAQRHILAHYAENADFLSLYKMIEQAEVTEEWDRIVNAERAVLEALREATNDFLLKYFLARVYFIYGDLYRTHHKKKQAVLYLEKSLAEAKEVIALQDRFSDAHRLAGDIYGWLIDLKGPMFYGPFYGPKSDAFVQRGIERDPENPEVHLAQGRSYLYTPWLFGGNKNKAITSFKQALSICPDYYMGHFWLGEAYRIIGEKENARSAFQKALEIAPNSTLAKLALIGMQ